MVHPADKSRVEQALEDTKNMYGAGRLTELRERTGLGLEDCKRIAEVDDLERAIVNLDTGNGDDVRRVLKQMLDLIR
jgi:hypothetical protein